MIGVLVGGGIDKRIVRLGLRVSTDVGLVVLDYNRAIHIA